MSVNVFFLLLVFSAIGSTVVVCSRCCVAVAHYKRNYTKCVVLTLLQVAQNSNVFLRGGEKQNAHTTRPRDEEKQVRAKDNRLQERVYYC